LFTTKGFGKAVRYKVTSFQVNQQHSVKQSEVPKKVDGYCTPVTLFWVSDELFGVIACQFCIFKVVTSSGLVTDRSLDSLCPELIFRGGMVRIRN